MAPPFALFGIFGPIHLSRPVAQRHTGTQQHNKNHAIRSFMMQMIRGKREMGPKSCWEDEVESDSGDPLAGNSSSR
jgi:hypothetical protein